MLMVRKGWGCRFGRHTWGEWGYAAHGENVDDDGNWIKYEWQRRRCAKCPRIGVRRVLVK